MTLQNRVTPLGDLVAAPGRGVWMGNRGLLHNTSRELTRSWNNRAWITCALSFRDQRLPLREPGHYTQLFFLDEAVALAAGHRPCAWCRRPAFDAYRDALAATVGRRLLAKELDPILHDERLDATTRRLHRRPWSDLPDGAFALVEDTAVRLAGDRLLPWRPDNSYGDPLPRPTTGTVAVITPPTSLAALAGGYPTRPSR